MAPLAAPGAEVEAEVGGTAADPDRAVAGRQGALQQQVAAPVQAELPEVERPGRAGVNPAPRHGE